MASIWRALLYAAIVIVALALLTAFFGGKPNSRKDDDI